jgi:GxxExxY protein
MNADERRLRPIAARIIGSAYRVANTLGSGFLEKVYGRALAHELRQAGVKVLQQHPVEVWHDGVLVNEYIADLLVEDRVVVELKCAKGLDDAHMAQCLNYLKATGLKLCLLLNFEHPGCR